MKTVDVMSRVGFDSLLLIGRERRRLQPISQLRSPFSRPMDLMSAIAIKASGPNVSQSMVRRQQIISSSAVSHVSVKHATMSNHVL